MRTEVGRESKTGGDIGSPDAVRGVVEVVGGKDRGAIKILVGTDKPKPMNKHKADGCPHGETERVGAATMGDGIAFTLVLLHGEIQADQGGGLELLRERGVIAQTPGAEVETDVVQGKGRFVGSGASVFARAEEEKEGKTDDVSKGTVGGGGGWSAVGQIKQGSD